MWYAPISCLPPLTWESARIEELGGAMIAAASAAGIGVTLVSMEPSEPRVVYVSDKGVEILLPVDVVATTGRQVSTGAIRRCTPVDFG